MSEPFVLNAYWKKRKQSLPKCAECVSALLANMPIHEVLTSWYPLLKSRKKSIADGPIAKHDITRIERLLLKGVIVNNSEDKNVIEELGYGTSLWNGSNKSSVVTCNIRCGAYANTIGLPLPNYINFQFDNADALMNASDLTTLLSLVSYTFLPDIAVVVPYGLWGKLPAPLDEIAYSSGWFVYLAVPKTSLPPFPPPVQTMPFANGSLITATPDVFDTSNNMHMAAYVSIAVSLREANLLPS